MGGSYHGLIIRVTFPADAEAIARIYIESWNAGFGNLLPKREINANDIARWQADLAASYPKHWWVAERDGFIVGFTGIGPSRDPIDPTLGELDTIAVDPKHWRSGVGRALMLHALHYLSVDGYRKAILWTLADYPRGAAFYRSTGWRPNGAVRDDGRHICFTHSLPAE